MTEKEFEEKEKSILDRMQEAGKQVASTGLKPGVLTQGAQFAYLVFLTYPDKATRPIADFSQQVYKALHGKSITYGIGKIHQTIADFDLHTIESVDLAIPDESVLEKLSKTAERSLGKAPWAIFGNYIHNDNSVVLRPQESRGNYELIELFGENATREGLEVRKAWGRHITVNRFTENISPEKLEAFLDLMKNPVYPNASADGDPLFAAALNVGYFILDKDGFDLHKTAAFPLS